MHSTPIISINKAETEALLRSDVFTPWVDPVTQVESFILTARVAPVQQSFYYVNQSLTQDGRYFWFYCAFPPSGSANNGRSLGVVDFREGRVLHFPDTQFNHASPLVDAVTGWAYWCNEDGIWKRPPYADGVAELVNKFSPTFTGGRRVTRYATHLTSRSDGRALHLDAEIGNDFYLGEAPLAGTEIVLWAKLSGPVNYNHGQFSPIDPDLILLAEDFYLNRATGTSSRYTNRLRLGRRTGELFPVYPQPIWDGGEDRRSRHGHEWWSADGQYVWYIHYNRGVERVAVADCNGVSNPLCEKMWNHGSVAHAHVDSSQTRLVLDSMPPDDPMDRRVTFVNLNTGRDINVVSYLPELSAETAKYHLHAHPHFCLGETLICYTTMVLGRVDVAFARVEDLVNRTS